MVIQLDRQLPVPVAIQLQGQIEYGMVNGDFPPGSQLPSVRALAQELEVSPVTVSEAYRTLAERGLIETVRGRGTFVRASRPSHPQGDAFERLERDATRLVRDAERLGVSRATLLEAVQRAVSSGEDDGAALRLVLVGVYPMATRAYANHLRRFMRRADRIVTTTFARLHASDEGEKVLRETDLLLTFAHREHELADLSPGTELATLKLVPSQQTRLGLAALEPRTRVALAALPEFLPTLRRGIDRFASHVASVTSVPAPWADAGRSFEDAEVVVYGTGCDDVLDDLPGGVHAFEYRHEPDPVHIEKVLLPLTGRLRRRARTSATTAGP